MFQELCDFKLANIDAGPGHFSLCKYILKAIHIEDLLQDIRTLSRGDEIIRNSPNFTEWMKPGSNYVFEVDVMPDKQRLKVEEKDTSKKADFFQRERSIDTVKLIWIYSKSVRVIDAKLCVFKEYEPMITENVLLYHEYEGFEEIAKLSGKQKMHSLIEVLTCIKATVLSDSLQAIIEGAADKAFSLEGIENLCYEVCLQDGYSYIGTVGSPSYCCRSFFTVNRIKGELVRETYEKLSKLLGSEIYKGILECIEFQVGRSLENEFPDLKLDTQLQNVFTIAALFDTCLHAHIRAISMVQSLFSPVDINDVVWRGNVAKEIHNTVRRHINTILRSVLPKIMDICTRTISDLDKVLKQLEPYKEGMTKLSQQELIQEWKKREIFRSKAAYNELAKYPSVLGYIAGKVNGDPAVRVFLQHDDKEVITYFTKNCKYPHNIHFINVTKRLQDNAVRVKHKVAPASIDISTKKHLHEIIQKEGERIMAKHSTIVGVGIDFFAPCVVLFCLHKQLIPFGEQKIPEQIEGYPVDIREQ